jgi:hypothetical protein
VPCRPNHRRYRRDRRETCDIIYLEREGITIPWKAVKRGNKAVIIKSDTGKVVGHSNSLAKAKSSVRARYAAEGGYKMRNSSSSEHNSPPVKKEMDKKIAKKKGMSNEEMKKMMTERMNKEMGKIA